MEKIKSPISVHLEITELCNNYCSHCYNPFRKSPINDSSDNSHKQRLKTAQEIINSDVFHVVLTGGEPLILKKETYDIAKLLSSNYVDVTLNSNVKKLDKNDVERIRESGIRSVLTSLMHYNPEIHDNISRAKGSWKETLYGIELLVNSNIPIGVNMVATKSTVNDIYKTGKFLAEKGVKSFCATRVAPNYSKNKCLDNMLNTEDTISLFEQLLALKKEFNLYIATLNSTPYCFAGPKMKKEYGELLKRSCAAGSTSATISSNGDLKDCQHGEIPLGNIVSEGMYSVWAKGKIWKDEFLPKECKKCHVKRACTGGCRETARATFGSLNDKDPLFKGPEYAYNPPKSEPVNLNAKFRFVKRLKYREETPNTGIIYKSPKSFVIMGKDGLDVCKKMLNHEFSGKTISESYGNNNTEICKFLGILKEKEIILNA